MLTMPMAPSRSSSAARSAGRLHVRGQRARDRRRCAVQEDHQLAADVQPGEVVVMRLGDRQAMPGEDQPGLERRRPARPAS